jgi:type IV secretion system protein VirB8
MLAELLKKLIRRHDGPKLEDTSDVVSAARNWYRDRYTMVVIQRNFLVLLSLLMMAALMMGAFVVYYVTTHKRIEPFVVAIEQESGITQVVNPFARAGIRTDQALHSYFIYTYLRARETYSFFDYEYNYGQIVRLLSSPEVYYSFRLQIADPTKSPVQRYSSFVSTSLKIRSMQFLELGKTVQVRFIIQEEGRGAEKYNRIATIKYEFMPMQLKSDELFINPLGFQVVGYHVTDEIL